MRPTPASAASLRSARTFRYRLASAASLRSARTFRYRLASAASLRSADASASAFTAPWLLPLLLPLLLLAACSRTPEAPHFPEPASLPALQARVSTDTPRVGDIIDVDIRLTAEERLLLPPWSDLLHDQVRLLEHTPGSPQTAPAESDPSWQRTDRLRVALYSVTNVTLFAKDTLKTLNDPPRDLPLPHLALTVEALTSEDDLPNLGNMDLMDFRGSEARRRARRNILLTLLGLLALTALLLWLRHRANRRIAPPPPLPKWDKIALRKMAELRESDIWTRADADASAVALSAILREYIEGRFHIHAPDLTTEEFLHEASAQQPWPASDQTELEAFFHAVDRIKFAAERPGAPALNTLMQAAERFVHVTAAPPQPGGAA